MRIRIVTWLFGILLLVACAPLGAQEKKDAPAPTPAPQQQPPPPQQQPPPAPAKTERDSPFVPYTLALVGIVIIMILVCMPVRRE